MKYTPHSQGEIEAMLQTIGLESLDQLFDDIPREILDQCRLPDRPGMTEPRLRAHLRELAGENLSADDAPCFLGGGCSDAFIPAAVGELLAREEFYTAYTPYQPELSQGILQSIFEYQTYICRLTGLDIANASLYDGGSALASACAIAAEGTKKKTILLPETVHPDYAQIVKTYASSGIMNVQTVPAKNGATDPDALAAALSDQVAAVVIPQPNYFGCLEPAAEMIAAVRQNSAALVIMQVDPVSLALLKSPGEYGADIAVGDAQPLGSPMSYGGPHVGFMAVTQKLMRKIPGRLIGETTDADGNRAFVLTLQAREQHIRREKANSNICSNEALNALAASIYLTVVGPVGFRQAAERSHRLALYAREQFELRGMPLLYNRPFFREFVVGSDTPEEWIEATIDLWHKRYTGEDEALNAKKITLPDTTGGIPVEGGVLLAFTEKRTPEEIDQLVDVMDDAREAIQ